MNVLNGGPFLVLLVLAMGCGDVVPRTSDGGTTKPCYSGPATTRGVGACKDGVINCAGGVCGKCVGEVTPTDELCGDDKDNDCDGKVDELGWREMAPMSMVRGYHCGVYHGGKVYIFGGTSNKTSKTDYKSHATAEAYDMATNTWSPIAPLLQARVGASCAVLGDKVYVAGGRYSDNTPSLQIYDIKKNAWSVGKPMNKLRSYSVAVPYQNKLYVVAGVGKGYLKSVAVHPQALHPR